MCIDAIRRSIKMDFSIDTNVPYYKCNLVETSLKVCVVNLYNTIEDSNIQHVRASYIEKTLIWQ